MNWGKWIVVSFLLFVGFMATIVTICMKQDVNLVSSQYYHDDLIYQEQLQRKRNTETLAQKPEITIDGSHLQVMFSNAPRIEGGTVKIFRPSNGKLDQNFSLSPSNSIQEFSLSPLDKGAYRVKLTWTAEGKEFYFEKFVVI